MTVQSAVPRLTQIREDFVDAAWRGLFGVAWLALPVSVWRAWQQGWTTPVKIVLLAAALAIVVHAGRRHLGPMVKRNLLLAFLWFASLAGLSSFGIAAPSLTLLTTLGFVAAMILPLRQAAVLIALALLTLAIGGAAYVQAWIRPSMDLNRFSALANSWVNLILLVSGISVTLSLAVGSFHRAVEALLVEVARQRDEIEHLATHDKLTGLPALRLAIDRIEMALLHARRVGQPVALLFVDLDGFKAVNDGFGHEAGDHVLAEVALRLKACVQTGDTVARIGGDEFLVVLTGLSDAAAAEFAAERIIAAVAEPIGFGAATLKVGASVGIGLFPEHARDSRTLRRVADEAMYQVKRGGKNGYALARPAAGTGGDAGGAASAPTVRGPWPDSAGMLQAPALDSYAAVPRLDRMRSDFVDTAWRGLYWVAWLALPVSAWRTLEFGWTPAFGVLLLTVTGIFGIHARRAKLSASIRAALLLFMLWFGSLAGLTSFGIASTSVALLTTNGFVAAVILPTRRFLMVMAAGMITMAVTGVAYVQGWLKPVVDLNQFTVLPSSWINLIVVVSGLSVIMALAIGSLHRAVEDLLVEVARQRDEIEHLATHDKLTGLPSLRLAIDRAEVAVLQARRADEKAALLFVDLDGFKAVNDGHGHEAGDHVLAEVAARLKGCLRASDTAARIGGDEFLVVLGDLDDASPAAEVAEKIIHAISQPIAFGTARLTVGASVGIGVFPDHAKDTVALRRVADAAMYRVKRAGKNAYALGEAMA